MILLVAFGGIQSNADDDTHSVLRTNSNATVASCSLAGWWVRFVTNCQTALSEGFACVS
jgi:hypothetical protein